MFSVDNFYDFFQSYYGWNKAKTTVWIFQPHGSKNLIDATAFHGRDTVELDWHLWSADKKLSKAIIMHDQELFYKKHSLNTYKEQLEEEEKNGPWASLTQEELFLITWHTCSWPIFCHSELNSPDIEWLKSFGVIECYYFWHGLIARDWFRHWRHSVDLLHKDTWKKRFLLYIRDCTGTRQYRAKVKEKLIGLKDQIDCDWEGVRDIDSDYSAKIVVEDAVNTAIHLVAETSFGSDKVHVTEKTFKPIVMNQPFIVFGGPGTLKYIRDYGFKTFGDIWDESYDQIVDEDDRLNKIIELINDLYQRPEVEFRTMIRQARDIVEHNRRWFFSDEFEKILLDEMHSNMQAALELQKQKEETDPGGSFFYMINSMHSRNVYVHRKGYDMLNLMVACLKDEDPGRYQRIVDQYPWVGDIT